MALKGDSHNHLRETLGETISKHSFNRWISLYKETQCAIRNPEEFDSELLGRRRRLSAKDSTFTLQLLLDKPGLFLDEITERLYNNTGKLLSVKLVHENLVNHLSITLKKAVTINLRKCLIKKSRYVEEMEFYPADFLVFTVIKAKLRRSQALSTLEDAEWVI
ncbi:hypothetical protein MJO29_006101 [Puccinia striiformis f. sp. tritici]|nr:hypothetical protein MJO29_006101 [Puccinia striiformis f. sp. tritici]